MTEPQRVDSSKVRDDLNQGLARFPARAGQRFRARRGRQGSPDRLQQRIASVHVEDHQRAADDSLVAGLAVTNDVGILQEIRAAVRENIRDAGVIQVPSPLHMSPDRRYAHPSVSRGVDGFPVGCVSQSETGGGGVTRYRRSPGKRPLWTASHWPSSVRRCPASSSRA